MAATITRSVTLETEECYNCGVVFAMPDYLMAQRRRDGQLFYCPSGHGQHYTDSDAKKLKHALSELAREKASADQRQAQLRDELERRTKSLVESQLQLSKQRTRAAAGVCPCCHRTFSQLARHMNTKHPDQARKLGGDG